MPSTTSPLWLDHLCERDHMPAPVIDQAAAPYSTYRIGGPMDVAWHPQSALELEALLTGLNPLIKKGDTTLSLIGWGSNTLIATNGIRGNTIITRKLDNIVDKGDGLFIIEAGVHLAKVAQTILKAGYTGAEYLIGIPGTMGGAVMMNAGAMGQETAEIVEEVLVYDFDANATGWLSEETLHFAYRYSALDPLHKMVLAVKCRFHPGDTAETKSRMDRNIAFRKAHHPIEPNGGSVFRNPEGGPAVGLMMDELGAKGVWTEGGAMVSPLHGNFIVNTGHATSQDVLTLMTRMQSAALEHSGKRILPENRFMGDATPDETALWKQLKEGDTHV
jgi:UDP-N-acetylmuramate dehydrogenase